MQAASSVGYSHFNYSHWLKVKAERIRLGINPALRTVDKVEHSLTGQTVVDTRTGNSFLVEYVRKDWFQGWFLSAMLNRNGSHQVCVVQNLSSDHDDILDQLVDFRTHFRTVL